MPAASRSAVKLIGGLEHLGVLAGRHDVHVGGTDLARPDDAELVVRVLDDRRDRARDTDAVRAHRHRDELAVLVEHLESERVGVLAPELEDVAHLDAARRLERATAVGARVAVADLGRLDHTVALEVAPGDQVDARGCRRRWRQSPSACR